MYLFILLTISFKMSLKCLQYFFLQLFFINLKPDFIFIFCKQVLYILFQTLLLPL